MIVGECIEQQLDRYRLIRLLGQSGSSEVYLGEHKELHVPVAIKMLHRGIAKSDVEKFQLDKAWGFRASWAPRERWSPAVCRASGCRTRWG